MKWTIINKNLTKRPIKVSEYRKYRSEIRLEAKEKCVYCAIHENSLGGSDNFHIEHFKPKSKFSALEKEFENLFYACAICNRFKSNDWPEEPNSNHSVPSYPDPKQVNYNTLFDIDENGLLHGKYVASKYIIEKIVLNRPQLINERKEFKLRARLDKAIMNLPELASKVLLVDRSEKRDLLLQEYMHLTAEIISFQNSEKKISRYRPSEIKRAK
ncbi:HNH endonuclease [uncultured Kordia sp.]|uniref:HNH endonuclease n=1 Tax=uncultured Kordia sp. TaxID=507699 RepID=UPI0026234B22|nr:HNH endonuclease [uncultured Kordia sp.]